MSDDLIRELRQLKWATVFNAFFTAEDPKKGHIERLKHAKEQTNDFVAWMNDQAAEQADIDRIAARAERARASYQVKHGEVDAGPITHTIVNPDNSAEQSLENLKAELQVLRIDHAALVRVGHCVREHEARAREMRRSELLVADARAYREITRLLLVPLSVTREDEAT